jgi:hypothetical protein
MEGRNMNNELGRICKEAVVPDYKVGKGKVLSLTAEIWSQKLPNMKQEC